MNYLYDYSVIGGDLRQVYIANELSSTGANVVCYGLCQTSPNSTITNSLDVAVKTARCIICPIPFKQCELMNSLSEGQYLFAGCIPKNHVSDAVSRGVKVCDLMDNNSLAIYNSIATAEGAVCEAITRSPINLHHSMCAVLGYGRCGKTLSNYLKGMFCNVSVYVNSADSQSYAATVCDRVGSLADFEEHAGDFDFVFNTIPAKVITDSVLAQMKQDVTVIDIASTPGGVDYAAAAERRINAALCLGLPGKYSPSSSAKAIINVIRSELSCL